MTGRGATMPSTTPRGRKSAAPLPSPAANQALRRSQFEGMERMFGKAEDPPSDAVGTPVRHAQPRHQHGITRVLFHPVGA